MKLRFLYIDPISIPIRERPEMVKAIMHFFEDNPSNACHPSKAKRRTKNVNIKE